MQAFWTWMARFIARRPWLLDRIFAIALRTPYAHIFGDDGSVYMGRWWLLRGRPAQEDSPWWLRWCPVAIRLHHIRREDLDRHLHDHPMDFRTLVVRGSYVEEDLQGHHRLVIAGMTYASRAQRFHRITEVDADQGAWSIFIYGRKRQHWGFLVGGRKVHWRTYLGVQEPEGAEQ